MCLCGTASKDMPHLMQPLFPGALFCVSSHCSLIASTNTVYPWKPHGWLVHMCLYRPPTFQGLKSISSSLLAWSFLYAFAVGSPNIIRSFLKQADWLFFQGADRDRRVIWVLTLLGCTVFSKTGWLCTLSWYRVGYPHIPVVQKILIFPNSVISFTLKKMLHFGQ